MSKEHTCEQIEKEQEELYESCAEKVKGLIEEARKRGVIMSLFDPPVENYNGEHVKVKNNEWVYPEILDLDLANWETKKNPDFYE